MEHKNYESLTFTDSFMFNKVMLDMDICEKILSLLLRTDIGPIDNIKCEENIQVSAQNKPIRLDIFTKDDQACYDAEMQNRNNKSLESIALPRRSRYYQSMIDIDAIDSGAGYRDLMDSNIIFICTFDPFGLGLPIYTFKNTCIEAPTLLLHDGCMKYFFNVTADPNKIPDDLKAFFRYTVEKKATDDLTRELDSRINTYRTNESWRAEYMYFNIIEQDAKAEGREEGLAEGREEGLAEGREEERSKTIRAINERDNALAEVERLKTILKENGIKIE
ncbi:MAG: Rpn family recombination-promoting nuclease/putative transposase [Lachnospiraceae bacterium]|nr:Rpn family recombination-promoting nuclease/putative transposase [Candidatus Colinaster equi]